MQGIGSLKVAFSQKLIEETIEVELGYQSTIDLIYIVYRKNSLPQYLIKLQGSRKTKYMLMDIEHTKLIVIGILDNTDDFIFSKISISYDSCQSLIYKMEFVKYDRASKVIKIILAQG